MYIIGINGTDLHLSWGVDMAFFSTGKAVMRGISHREKFERLILVSLLCKFTKFSWNFNVHTAEYMNTNCTVRLRLLHPIIQWEKLVRSEGVVWGGGRIRKLSDYDFLFFYYSANIKYNCQNVQLPIDE